MDQEIYEIVKNLENAVYSYKTLDTEYEKTMLTSAICSAILALKEIAGIK